MLVLLFLLHVVGDVVNGIDDIHRLPLAVQFHNSVAMEFQPLRSLLRARVPPLLQFKLAFPAAEQELHLLLELLALVGVDALGKHLQGQSGVGQQMSVAIGHQIPGDVVLHHQEVSHLQRLSHHQVDVGRGALDAAHMRFCQTNEQIDDEGEHQDAHGDVDGHGRGVVLSHLGMEPAVVQLLHLTILLHARVEVVNRLYEFLVPSDDVDVAHRDVHLVQTDELLNVEFLQLPLQRRFVPHEVLVFAFHDAPECLLGWLIVQLRMIGELLLEELSRIPSVVEHRLLRVGQILQRHNALRVVPRCHAHAVVGNRVAGASKLGGFVLPHIVEDDVGLPLAEEVHRLALLHHLKLVGDAHLVEHSREDIDVEPRGLRLVVVEFVGRLVPVARDDERAVLRVARLCPQRVRAEEQEAAEDERACMMCLVHALMS